MSHIQPRSNNQKQGLQPDKEKARKESQTVTKEHLQVHSKSLGETLTLFLVFKNNNMQISTSFLQKLS